MIIKYPGLENRSQATPRKRKAEQHVNQIYNGADMFNLRRKQGAISLEINQIEKSLEVIKFLRHIIKHLKWSADLGYFKTISGNSFRDGGAEPFDADLHIVFTSKKKHTVNIYFSVLSDKERFYKISENIKDFWADSENKQPGLSQIELMKVFCKSMNLYYSIDMEKYTDFLGVAYKNNSGSFNVEVTDRESHELAAKDEFFSNLIHLSDEWKKIQKNKDRPVHSNGLKIAPVKGKKMKYSANLSESDGSLEILCTKKIHKFDDGIHYMGDLGPNEISDIKDMLAEAQRSLIKTDFSGLSRKISLLKVRLENISAYNDFKLYGDKHFVGRNNSEAEFNFINFKEGDLK